MDLKLLLLLPTLLFFNKSHAGDHMLLLGGGGEPDCKFAALSGPNSKPNCEKTIFDGGLRKFSRSVDFSRWKYKIAFDGGHSETESILKWKFPSPVVGNTNFTVNNYNNILKDYAAQIESGKIKQGDKLMVVIAAHGAFKKPGELSHSIAAEGSVDLRNKDNLSLSSLVSLDALSNLIKLTNQKGIKLGIVDLSCRSGNTLALAVGTSNTCIISATGMSHFAYLDPDGFAEKFLENLAVGKNLEDVFLKSRLHSEYPEYPMISTEMNEKISSFVYEKITPYLFFKSESHDIITDYMLSNANAEIMCKRDEQFTALINQINRLERATSRNIFSYDGEDFKAYLLKYKKLQDSIMEKLKITNAQLIKSEKFSLMMNVTGEPPTPLNLEFTWQKILSLDPDKIVKQFDKFALESKTLKDKENNQYVSDIYKLISKKRAEILKTHPHLKNVREEALKLTKMMSMSLALSKKIIAEEKKLYDGLYKEYSNNKKSNPCREFVF